jgi:hypothetical protein
MPNWVKRIFLILLPRVLFMRQPRHKIQIGNLHYTYSTLLAKSNLESENNEKMVSQRSPSIYDFRFMRPSLHHGKSHSCNNSRSNTPVRTNKASGRQLPEVIRAIEGINYVCEHLKRDDQEKVVKEQWKYVALVVDRFFFLITKPNFELNCPLVSWYTIKGCFFGFSQQLV